MGDAAATLWRRDLDALATLLLHTSADVSEPVALSREELVDRLAWRRRIDLLHPHDFPVPEVTYRPITATVDALERAIDGIRGGYVAILGSPGSGKSTLLTETLRYREQVVRYYAYVPPAFGTNTHRGEAQHFLHDMVVALDRLGVQAGGDGRAG